MILNIYLHKQEISLILSALIRYYNPEIKFPAVSSFFFACSSSLRGPGRMSSSDISDIVSLASEIKLEIHIFPRLNINFFFSPALLQRLKARKKIM